MELTVWNSALSINIVINSLVFGFIFNSHDLNSILLLQMMTVTYVLHIA